MTSDAAVTPRRCGTQPFVISRTFMATRARVWRAWTDAQEMSAWSGSKGCPMEIRQFDLRPGGVLHYCMPNPDGMEMWGRWAIREVVAPERLVVVQSFSDAEGGITRHPMAATWPLEVLSTATFSERDGRTTLDLAWLVHAGTEEEHRTFDGAHAGMQQGWSRTFEQLAEHLHRARG